MIINNALSSKLISNNIVTFVIATFMAFWLSACGISSPSTVQTQNPAQSDGVIPSDEKLSAEKVNPLDYEDCVYPSTEVVQACTAKGGEFSKQGRLGCYSCVVSYDDAGKTCQDSSDCQGVCNSDGEFVDSGTANQMGQCSSDSSPFGCYQLIDKGVSQPAICID